MRSGRRARPRPSPGSARVPRSRERSLAVLYFPWRRRACRAPWTRSKLPSGDTARPVRTHEFGAIGPDLMRALHMRALGPKAHEGDPIDPLARDEHEVIVRRRHGCRCVSPPARSRSPHRRRAATPRPHPRARRARMQRRAGGVTARPLGIHANDPQPVVEIVDVREPVFRIHDHAPVMPWFFTMPSMSAVLSDAISRCCASRSPLSSPEMSNTWNPASYAPR